MLFSTLSEFMARGGPVLWFIAADAAILGFLVIERYWFIQLSFPRSFKARCRDWRLDQPQPARRHLYLRRALLAQAELALTGPLQLLRLVVALCPMLGLLGTITGMMQVFDALALQGSADVRGMAAGISRATLPTMAGMGVALPGLYFGLQLKKLAERQLQQLAGMA